MHKLLDMSLKSGLEVCWWDVLQPAQVMVGWGPEKKLFGAGGGGRAGTNAGVSSVRAVSVRKKRLRMSYEQVFEV